ncbi:hypothetical protein J6590_064272 [Homalodisca vitripennis]|nr:hypothetical protein J6590_064272 [Homalodisca vitripennis]
MAKLSVFSLTVLAAVVVVTLSHSHEPQTFQVSVEIKGGYSCTGAVFTAYYILTAASCVYNVSTSDVLVRTNTVTPGWRGTVHMVREVAIHPDYTPDSLFPANIALLKLQKKLHFGNQITPVTLWRRMPHIGSEGFTTGWGTACEQFNEISQKAQLKKSFKVPVVIAEPRYCFVINNRTYLSCVSSTTSLSYSPCQTDMGGLLIIHKKLAGLNLLTINRALSVFTSISPYITWIKSAAFRTHSENFFENRNK